jgi:hypothetical protein
MPPCLVSHELASRTQPYLASDVIDAVIDEDLLVLAQRAVDRLVGAALHAGCLSAAGRAHRHTGQHTHRLALAVDALPMRAAHCR